MNVKGNGGRMEKNVHNWESNHCFSTGNEDGRENLNTDFPLVNKD